MIVPVSFIAAFSVLVSALPPRYPKEFSEKDLASTLDQSDIPNFDIPVQYPQVSRKPYIL